MPQPRRKTLLEAADSYPLWGAPENRLTEIFGEVLRTSPQLTAWLIRHRIPDLADLVSNSKPYDVKTQFILDGGSERPDMQIDVDGIGRYVYVENKLGAELTPAQRGGYAAVRDSHVLMAIVPARRVSEFLFPPNFHVLTWEQVGFAAYKIGRTWGQKTWRTDALKSTAPGECRLIAEFCRYLEEVVGMSIGEPIERNDAEVIAGAEVALQRWWDLRNLIVRGFDQHPDLVRRYADGKLWHPYQEGRNPDQNSLGWEVRIKAPWPALREALPPGNTEDWWQLGGLIASPETSWVGGAGDSEPEPAFGAGISVRIDGDWPEGLREGDPLRVASERQKFRFGITRWRGGVTGRVFRTMPLRDLEDIGSTIQEQADYVVDWVRASLDALMHIQI
jgi:hypothetical protein